jgi:hypothetical protein
MKKKCVICGQSIDTKEEPYFKIGRDYICDDTVNVECCVNYLGRHRKNEDKTE